MKEKYITHSYKIHPKTKELMSKEKIKSGLSWNLFFYYLSKQNGIQSILTECRLAAEEKRKVIKKVWDKEKMFNMRK